MKLASIGLSGELIDLAATVSDFAVRVAPVGDTRDRLAAIAGGQRLPSWDRLVQQDFHRVHLPEGVGGGGAGLVELAVITEQLGRMLFPGPFLPTVMTSAVLAACPPHPVRDRLLGELSAGRTAALVVDGALALAPAGDGYVLSGASGPVSGLPGAEIVLLLVELDGEGSALVEVPTEAAPVSVTELSGSDLTRATGRIEVHGLAVEADQLVPCRRGAVDLIDTALLAAEAAGVAQGCLEATLEHIKQREQFGRIIGSFQAVQHKAALMLVHSEVIRAAAWDAARAADDDDEDQQGLAANAAALNALQLVRDVAVDAVLMHGGMGYTWEHDAQLYWRKAIGLAGAGGARQPRATALGAVSDRAARDYGFVGADELPELREQIRAGLDQAKALMDSGTEADHRAARALLADAGLVAAHYPPPYGIGAGPEQQVVIAQEFTRRNMAQPNMVVGEWVLPTLLLHGSTEQQKRFVADTLRGDIDWCQLFSEPGAGSDLAALSTSARRTPGGWLLSGQKVWTSNAHLSQWGACLARTDPQAPKHRGISYFLVDMTAPGIEIRPLRQATGRSEFNEVFLTDVFVPDDCLVGEINDGWKLATTTLANERLKMGTDFGHGSARLLREARDAGDTAVDDAEVTRVLGECTAREMALAAMRLRAVLGSISGLDTGATTSVQKVFNALAQRQGTTDILSLVGSVALCTGGARDYVTDHLSLPAVMTGGGTVEIQLNVIANWLLGLPR